MNKKLVAATLTLIMSMQVVLGVYDLGDYPGFLFDEDRNLVSYVVIGSGAPGGGNAAGLASDLAGAVDLAVRLAAESYEEVPLDDDVVVEVEGDSQRVDKSTDFLEYGEDLDDVLEVLTAADLSGLTGGTFKNAKGSFDYNEYIVVPEEAYGKFDKDPDDDTETPANYLFFEEDKYAYIYKLEFPTAMEVTIADKNTHLENKKITMLGAEYTVTDATNVGGNEDSWKLTLMGGSSKVTGYYGEALDLVVGGTTYTVTPSVYSGDEVVFTVEYEGTTETSDTLDEGDTYTLDDGTELGVSDIRYTAREDIMPAVTYFLGADKLVIEDNEIEDDTNFDEKLVSGTNSLSDTQCKITGSDDGTTLKISTIEIKWTPDEDIYVPVEGKLSDYEESGEEGQVFGGLDVEFVGIKQSSTEEVKLETSGDDEYTLEFTNEVGNTAKLPYLHCNGDTLELGEEDHSTYLTEPPSADSWNITKDDYFVVTSGTSSYVLQYKGSDADDNTIDFKNVATGDTLQITYNTGNVDNYHNDTADATLILGGKDFDVWIQADANDEEVVVDMNDDGETESADEVTIYTQYRAHIDFNVGTLTDGFVLETEELDDDYTNGPKEIINVTVSCSSDELDIAAIDGVLDADEDRKVDAGETDTVTMIPVGDTNNEKEVSKYGVLLDHSNPSNDPSELTMTYPDDQSEVLVYVTTGATSTTTSGGGSTTRNVVPITTPVAKLDTEVSVPVGKHLVLVGGPAVNRLTAEALGYTFPAYGADVTEVTEGEGYIEVLEDVLEEGYVSVVVFGYEAEDTRNAASVLQKYEDFTEQLDGNVAVKVTSVTAGGITPVVEEPVVEGNTTD
jgi:hypothetical protein